MITLPRHRSGRSTPLFVAAFALPWLFASLLLVGCDATSEDSADDTGGATAGGAAAAAGELVLYTPGDSTSAYLVDATNAAVHTWPSQYYAGQSAFLLDDGSIVRAASIDDIAPDNRFVTAYRDGHNTAFHIGGIVERISKEGEVVWTFEYYSDDYAPHHVVQPMPNGNLLMPVWRYHSEDEALALGRDPKHLSDGGLWIESIIEVRPTEDGGEIVWEWQVADHLIQNFDESKANYGDPSANLGRIDINYGRGFNVPEDFMHINSAFYLEEFDQIVMTSYHYSELWVIDHSTTTEEAAGDTGGRYGKGGELLYRWGNPWVYGRDDAEVFLLSAVHDPKWLADERHFIMYDNNVKDPGRDLDGGNSMVVEIAPPITADGSYSLADDGVYGPAQPLRADDLGIAASSVGTAQRLGDGRTLSCDCPNSQAIWLDAAGAVSGTMDLWQNTTTDADTGLVFRLVGYTEDDAGVQALQLGSPEP